MGCSTTPWLKLDVDTVQGHVNIVYAGHDYTVENSDGFHTSVRPHTRWHFAETYLTRRPTTA